MTDATKVGPGNFRESRENKKYFPTREWGADIVEKPVMRELYRIVAKDRDIDSDLEECTRDLNAKDDWDFYYLKVSWRVLMRDYALPEALRVGKKLAEREAWHWRLWRWLQGYSMPRLWVAMMIGYVGMLSADRVLRQLEALAGGYFWRSMAAVLLLVFYLGMSDVQHRVGRHWGRVWKRSAVVFGYGLVFSAGAWRVHCFCWPTGHPGRRYAALLAACALALGHLVQLFWTENSISDPL